MSVTKRGGKWTVRWYDDGRRGRRRYKTFDLKEDAELFDAEVKRRRRLGTLAHIDAGAETLDHYTEHVFTPAHTAHLSPRTLTYYAQLYDFHISPTLGTTPLRMVTPELIGTWQAQLVAAGVGRATVRKAWTLLGQVLQRAFEGQRIPFNPHGSPAPYHHRHRQRYNRSRRRPSRQSAPTLPATKTAARTYAGCAAATPR